MYNLKLFGINSRLKLPDPLANELVLFIELVQSLLRNVYLLLQLLCLLLHLLHLIVVRPHNHIDEVLLDWIVFAITWFCWSQTTVSLIFLTIFDSPSEIDIVDLLL